MRILIVAHGHPELGAGGAQLAAYQLFRSLAGTPGITACFLAADDDRLLPADAPEITPFRARNDEFLMKIDDFDAFSLSRQTQASVEAFAIFVEKFRPDIVHFHHYLNIGVNLIGVARWSGKAVRVVVTLHEYLAICHHHGLMVRTAGNDLCRSASDERCAECFPDISPARFAQRKKVVQAGLMQADRFIAPSLFLKARYAAWGIPDNRIAGLDNGVEISPPLPSVRAPGEGRRTFAFFGQINPYKGLDCLLSAFDQLARDPHPTAAAPRLIVHGAHLEANHPDFADRIRRSLARHANRIEFSGPYERSDLPRLMAAADWVVVPSTWWENAPMIIEEALASRRPVICSAIGGMREKVRQGLDGFHFPVGDAQALAVLMRQLSADERIWDRLQRTLRTPVTIAESAAGHLALYRSIRTRSVPPSRA